MLAELVKAGKLPPVEQRVPEEPMVLKPMREIGKYGGTWRRGFTGPADTENVNRVMGGGEADLGRLHRLRTSSRPCSKSLGAASTAARRSASRSARA